MALVFGLRGELMSGLILLRMVHLTDTDTRCDSAKRLGLISQQLCLYALRRLVSHSLSCFDEVTDRFDAAPLLVNEFHLFHSGCLLTFPDRIDWVALVILMFSETCG